MITYIRRQECGLVNRLSGGRHFVSSKQGDVSLQNMKSVFRWDVLYPLIVLPCGLFMIFFDRYPARNDGEAHWLRAVQVASGLFVPLRDPAGGDRYGGFRANGAFASFNNTAINSPFLYYPTIFSQFFFRYTAEHVQYVAASISTLLCCTVCIALAIHIAGQMGELIAATAFIPTVFLSMVFPSADAVTNSFALLFIAVVCRYSVLLKATSWQTILILSLLCIGLAQIKTTCLVLMLLIGLIAWRQYRHDRHIPIEYFIPLGFGVSSALIWWWQIRSISPWILSYQQYVDGKQLLIHHPFAFLKGVIMTVFQPLDLSKDQYNVKRNIQLYTGTENTMLPMTVMVFFIISCIALWMVAASKSHLVLSKMEPADRVFIQTILASIIVLFYLLTCVAMALVMGYTPQNLGKAFDGMQSRYFVPVLPLIGIMLLIPNWGIVIRHSKALERCVLVFLWLGFVGILAAHTIRFI